MPDHVHLIIIFEEQGDISDMMRDMKKFTAVRIFRQADIENNEELLSHFNKAGEETGRSKHKVWQDSSWDSLIYGQNELRRKLNYIHRNPVRAGLVAEPGNYPYSSFRNYVNHDHSLIVVDMDWLQELRAFENAHLHPSL